jgi:iron complex outermembrane recepter protein
MVFQRRKVASALAYMLGAGGVVSLNAVPAQAADIKMEITGSSIRRVEAEGALPVTVVTKEDIQRTGATNTEQLLQQAVSALSTMNATNLAAGAGLSTYGQTSVSLRGLGSFRTLVLVNGRRLSPFAGDDGASVNVNAIPVAAIERIEVLRDGASAIYGSDAIAGVINFILTKDYTGVEVGGQYGAPTQSGGGDSYEVHAVAGFGVLDKDRYNVTIGANYTKDKVLWSRDRDFAKTGNQYPYLVSGATGQGNIQGAWVPGTGSAANGTWVEGTPVPGFGTPGSSYGNPLAATNNCEQVNMFKNPTNTNKGVPFCAFDSAAFLNLQPEREAINGSASFLFDITKDIQFFADGLYAKQKVTNTIQPSPLRLDFMQSDTQFQTLGIDPVLLIYPSNPNYQIAANYLNANGFSSLVGQPLGITSRVFDFGLRQTEDEATQWRIVTGLRGNWRNNDWEVAYTHNENKVEGSTTSGYFSQTQYARVLQQSTDWNPWSLQQSDALNSALAVANYAGPTLNSTAKSDNVDGKITGDIMQMPAGPLAYALGAQWRREEIDLQPSAALLTGDIAGLGGATGSVNQNRSVTAVFGEINVPILKGLEGSAAIRYDDYSDFGGTTNYFLNLRYQPIKEILLRGSYGTGFRAPTLRDLWDPITLGASEQFADPYSGDPNLQVNAFSGGNPALKPETSTQWSYGFVIQPVAQFSFSMDWFQIKLEDIISTPGAQEVVDGFARGDPAYANSVVLNSSGQIETISTQTVNAGSATVEGFDVTLDYKDSFPWGRVGANLQGTYMSKFDQTSPGGILFHKVGTLVNDAGEAVIGATDTGGVVLRWKHIATLSYGYGAWNFALLQNYYNGYRTANRQIDDEPNFVKAQSIFDAYVSYTGIKNLRLALGVKNIFDRDPPIYIPVSNQFQAGYDASVYDPRSRFVYGSINYKFY